MEAKEFTFGSSHKSNKLTAKSGNKAVLHLEFDLRLTFLDGVLSKQNRAGHLVQAIK